MTTIQQRIYDGSRAREVLENEAYVAAFAAVESDLIESWKNIPSTPQTERERDRIHLSLTMLRKMQSCLQSTLETGKLAEVNLQYEQTMADRAKQFLGMR